MEPNDPNQQAQPTPEDTLAATNQALMKKKKPVDQSYSPAQISQAMAQVAPSSPAGKVGKVLNANNQWAGLCEAYVENQTYGKTGMYPSATAAADTYAKNGQLKTGLDGIKQGDIIYFSDPNQPDGHAAIYKDNNVMQSALSKGVTNTNISEWLKYSGQSILGYVSPPK